MKNKHPTDKRMITSSTSNSTSSTSSGSSSSSSSSRSDPKTTFLDSVRQQLNDPPSNVVYFNNAGKVPLPPTVQQAGQKAVHEESNPWVQQQQLNQITNQTRQLFAQLIGSNNASDIAITPSTGFALTMVAHNLLATGVLKGQRSQILILQDEMSSEVYCWQEICAALGGECALIIVPHPSQEEDTWTQLILNELQNDINNDIRVVCIPQVHWSDGSYIDLKRIGEECHRRSIIFIVDGTQSVGIFPLDVKEIRCHVLAASVHKWLLGPHGASLVYIDSQYHNTWKPLDQHERSRIVFQDEVYDATENNIEGNGYPTEFVSGAARLDSGGKKNPVLLPMVCEGLRIVNQIDKCHAQEYLKMISDEVLDGAKIIGFNVQPGPRVGHIVGLRPYSSELKSILTPSKMVDVANNLKQKGIYVAVRCGAFRIAPYLNTTSDDVKILLQGLKEECDNIRLTG